jgi:hypothetical protein
VKGCLKIAFNPGQAVQAAEIDDDDDLSDELPSYMMAQPASGSCVKNEALVRSEGWTCLRKCTSDTDCISKKKKCICDGHCGMSCAKPGKYCPQLTPPRNGYVDVSNLKLGGKAVYRCEGNYYVVGQQVRTCTAHGNWTGSNDPSCEEERKHFLFLGQ